MYPKEKHALIFIITLLAMCAISVSCRPDGPEPDPEPVVPEGAVDMGIVLTYEDGTSYNLYWAEANLSESGLCPHPWDFGDYFAWGETEPYYTTGHSQDKTCVDWRSGKNGYYWDSYTYCNGRDVHARLTRYCPSDKPEYWGGSGSPDNKTEFKDYGYADDAARAILHGKWRIPTREEWAALRDQCTWTYTIREGVNGYQVSAANGNSIFIPETGYRMDDRLLEVGDSGNYWSSTADMEETPSYAWYLFLKKEKYVGEYKSSRYYGHPVRPVSE